MMQVLRTQKIQKKEIQVDRISLFETNSLNQLQYKNNEQECFKESVLEKTNSVAKNNDAQDGQQCLFANEKRNSEETASILITRPGLRNNAQEYEMLSKVQDNENISEGKDITMKAHVFNVKEPMAIEDVALNQRGAISDSCKEDALENMKHMRNSKQGTTNQPTYIGNDYDKG